MSDPKQPSNQADDSAQPLEKVNDSPAAESQAPQNNESTDQPLAKVNEPPEGKE